MDLAGLLLFAAVFGVACASPGPTLVALVARIIGSGMAGIPSFCAGLVIGDLIWLACAVFGLAALADWFQPLFLIVKYLGAAYLLYLGWRLWTTPVRSPMGLTQSNDRQTPGGNDRPVLGAIGGIALTLGNPKTMLFYLALLPTVVSLSQLGWTGFLELGAIVVVIYCFVLLGYIGFATRSRALVKSARAMRIVNRTGGTIMAGAAVVVATRN